MELAIPRKLIPTQAGTPGFDFHWADNLEGVSSVSEFNVNGDSAPNRHWNYRFEVGQSR